MMAHILLVEDDDHARRALAYQLQYAGYRVTQAPNGSTALDLLEQHTFDVVLSDIVLGDTDGIEILHTARIQPGRPAVVLLTGHATLETSLAALREGATDYLLKPCTPEDLLAAVAKAVRNHQEEINMRQVTTLLKDVYAQTLDPAAPPGTAPAIGRPGIPDNATDMPSTEGFQFGELWLGPSRHDVWLNGNRLRLTPIEFGILRFLAETPGRVRLCRDIVQRTHHLQVDDTEAQMLVKQHVRNLRKKLDAPYLVNQRGVGYKLVAPGNAPDEADMED